MLTLPYEALRRTLARATGARDVALGQRVQVLWGGYGEIRRVTLVGAPTPAAIVKYVVPPVLRTATHSEAEVRSHRRKLRSYEVERAFYERYAGRCGRSCRVPRPLHIACEAARTCFVLEDLDASGFELRRTDASDEDVRAALRWLANFHATFLNEDPQWLWPEGSYWHLATRPDELRAVKDAAVRRAAASIDRELGRARFRTFVHGDAKLENFCFSLGGEVAAVDFQYVGGGVGVKDVAYFLSSCLTQPRLERDAEAFLEGYFSELRAAVNGLPATTVSAASFDAEALEAEWRRLYPVACADFYRFLLGWAGENTAYDGYLHRMTRRVLEQRL